MTRSFMVPAAKARGGQPNTNNTGTKPGDKITITTDNNSNIQAKYAPPKEGHKILKQDNMVSPHQG